MSGPCPIRGYKKLVRVTLHCREKIPNVPKSVTIWPYIPEYDTKNRGDKCSYLRDFSVRFIPGPCPTRGYKRLVRVTLCHGEKIPNVSKKCNNLTLLHRVSYEKSRRINVVTQETFPVRFISGPCPIRWYKKLVRVTLHCREKCQMCQKCNKLILHPRIWYEKSRR